ncbi:hypothetical protein ABIE67_010249 [Streptomyces sp. V4I8]|uniref:hypothetical protein n=1 Tax=Streptomyces sp. V4I8 TaxID=3156469 RepID=UPI00351971DD
MSMKKQHGRHRLEKQTDRRKRVFPATAAVLAVTGGLQLVNATVSSAEVVPWVEDGKRVFTPTDEDGHLYHSQAHSNGNYDAATMARVNRVLGRSFDRLNSNIGFDLYRPTEANHKSPQVTVEVGDLGMKPYEEAADRGASQEELESIKTREGSTFGRGNAHNGVVTLDGYEFSDESIDNRFVRDKRMTGGGAMVYDNAKGSLPVDDNSDGKVDYYWIRGDQGDVYRQYMEEFPLQHHTTHEIVHTGGEYHASSTTHAPNAKNATWDELMIGEDTKDGILPPANGALLPYTVLDPSPDETRVLKENYPQPQAKVSPGSPESGSSGQVGDNAVAKHQDSQKNSEPHESEAPRLVFNGTAVYDPKTGSYTERNYYESQHGPVGENLSPDPVADGTHQGARPGGQADSAAEREWHGQKGDWLGDFTLNGTGQWSGRWTQLQSQDEQQRGLHPTTVETSTSGPHEWSGRQGDWRGNWRLDDKGQWQGQWTPAAQDQQEASGRSKGQSSNQQVASPGSETSSTPTDGSGASSTAAGSTTDGSSASGGTTTGGAEGMGGTAAGSTPPGEGAGSSTGGAGSGASGAAASSSTAGGIAAGGSTAAAGISASGPGALTAAGETLTTSAVTGSLGATPASGTVAGGSGAAGAAAGGLSDGLVAGGAGSGGLAAGGAGMGTVGSAVAAGGAAEGATGGGTAVNAAADTAEGAKLSAGAAAGGQVQGLQQADSLPAAGAPQAQQAAQPAGAVQPGVQSTDLSVQSGLQVLGGGAGDVWGGQAGSPDAQSGSMPGVQAGQSGAASWWNQSVTDVAAPGAGQAAGSSVSSTGLAAASAAFGGGQAALSADSSAPADSGWQGLQGNGAQSPDAWSQQDQQAPQTGWNSTGTDQGNGWNQNANWGQNDGSYNNNGYNTSSYNNTGGYGTGSNGGGYETGGNGGGYETGGNGGGYETGGNGGGYETGGYGTGSNGGDTGGDSGGGSL